jgi:hypothetical protein
MMVFGQVPSVTVLDWAAAVDAWQTAGVVGAACTSAQCTNTEVVCALVLFAAGT